MARAEVQRLGEGMNVLYGPTRPARRRSWNSSAQCSTVFRRSGGVTFRPCTAAGPAAASKSPPQRTLPDRAPRRCRRATGQRATHPHRRRRHRQGEHVVKVLLSNIDETIFNNIFAVGLREMQELGALSDTAAAELLYNLSAGLDRISLVEVMGELETSRNRILDRSGGPCQIVQLLPSAKKSARRSNISTK